MPPLLLPSEKDRDIIMSCTREGCTVFLFLSLSVRVYVCARAFEGGVQERERERERETCRPIPSSQHDARGTPSMEKLLLPSSCVLEDECGNSSVFLVPTLLFLLPVSLVQVHHRSADVVCRPHTQPYGPTRISHTRVHLVTLI